MKCSDAKHIIDQVRNRELPKSALSLTEDHLETCETCRIYLDESITLREIIRCCKEVDQPDADLFRRLEENIEREETAGFTWEAVVCHSNVKRTAAAAMVLVVIVLAGFAWYHNNLANHKSISDEKLEASIERLPDGAILMKTSDGEEIIFIDPALEADGTLDEAMKELEAIMNNDSEHLEEFHFASQ